MHVFFFAVSYSIWGRNEVFLNGKMVGLCKRNEQMEEEKEEEKEKVQFSGNIMVSETQQYIYLYIFSDSNM